MTKSGERRTKDDKTENPIKLLGENYGQRKLGRNTVEENPRERELLNGEWAAGCVSRGGHSTQVVGRGGGEVGKLHNRGGSDVVGVERIRNRHKSPPQNRRRASFCSTPNVERHKQSNDDGAAAS